MKRFLINRAKVILAFLPVVAVGCNAEVKSLLIDQGIGFLSSIGAAAATSLMQSVFGTTG